MIIGENQNAAAGDLIKDGTDEGFMADVIAPTNRDGDMVGSRWLPGGAVVTPDSFKPAYSKWVGSGFGAMPFDPDYGGGGLAVGKDAIREVFAGLVATGRKFELGHQQAATISGDLALTSTRLRDGGVTAEVARRQRDGTWLWVLDRFSIT